MLHSKLGHIADPLRHTEITLKDVTNSTYHLGLFVKNQKIELEKKGDWTRTPAQRLYVLLSSLHANTEGSVCRDIFTTSEMRVDIQRITASDNLAKSQQTNEVIDLQGLFKDYWGSNMREFTVPSQS